MPNFSKEKTEKKKVILSYQKHFRGKVLFQNTTCRGGDFEINLQGSTLTKNEADKSLRSFLLIFYIGSKSGRYAQVKKSNPLSK